MFVKIVKGGKDQRFEYVHIVEAIRDENGKPRQKLIQNLGRKDKLLEADPQAMDKLYAQYGGTRTQKDQKAATIRTKAAIESLQNPIDARDRPLVRIRYGNYVVRHIWRNILELNRKFEYIQNHGDFPFDVDEAACFLTTSKILDPYSAIRAGAEQDRYLGAPVQDFSESDLYDFLGVVKDNKDSLMRWANKALSKSNPDDRTSLVFFDLLKTFSHSSFLDDEKVQEPRDFLENVTELIERDDIRQQLFPDCFDRDGEVHIEHLPDWFWEIACREKPHTSEMRGPSLPYQSDLPRSSIALIIDKYGFPLDFAVYAGNPSEVKSMESTIADLNEKYRPGQSMVIGDRGFNSESNLPLRRQEHNDFGFLRAWKITNLGEGLTAKMLDESLYTPFSADSDHFGRYQVIKNFRSENSKDPVEGTLVFMFHPKRYKRDIAVLNIWKDFVLAKAQAGEKVGSEQNSWACLARVSATEENKILGINEEVYEQKLALCGYSAIVFRPAHGSKTDELTPQEIAGRFLQLNQIRECFRVMKNNRGLKPAFSWDSDHVDGYLTICLLALMILRYIQKRAEAAGQKLSVYEICKALKDAELVCRKDQTGKVYLHPVIKPDENVRVGWKNRSSGELIEELQKEKKLPSTIDTIMKVCGLQPLKSTYSRNELARCLNTKFYFDEVMLSELVLAQME